MKIVAISNTLSAINKSRYLLLGRNSYSAQDMENFYPIS